MSLNSKIQERTKSLQLKMISENNLLSLNEDKFFLLRDYFNNEDFMMEYTRSISPLEMLMRKRYAKMLAIKTTGMSKEKIIDIKKKKRSLKIKLKEYEKILLEKMNQKIQYNLFRVEEMGGGKYHFDEFFGF